MSQGPGDTPHVIPVFVVLPPQTLLLDVAGLWKCCDMPMNNRRKSASIATTSQRSQTR